MKIITSIFCNKTYLIGIMSNIIHQYIPVQQSVAVTIPGDIFEWVMENDGGKDIKECLVDEK